MDRIRIRGGHKLDGTIPISGAKNATLPLMIASLLTEQTLILDNVPRLADVALLQRILGNHGVDHMVVGKRPGQTTETGQTIRLTASNVIDTTAPYELVSTMRAAEVEDDELKEITVAAGLLAAAASRPLIPVRTGRLAGSLRSNKAARRATVAVGRAAVPYAGPIHWGWPGHNIEAQPFGVEGLERAEPGITALYVAGIEKILDRVKGA